MAPTVPRPSVARTQSSGSFLQPKSFAVPLSQQELDAKPQESKKAADERARKEREERWKQKAVAELLKKKAPSGEAAPVLVPSPAASSAAAAAARAPSRSKSIAEIKREKQLDNSAGVVDVAHEVGEDARSSFRPAATTKKAPAAAEVLHVEHELGEEVRSDAPHPSPQKQAGPTERYGGGGERSWKKQDDVLHSLDSLDSMFDKVLK